MRSLNFKRKVSYREEMKNNRVQRWHVRYGYNTRDSPQGSAVGQSSAHNADSSAATRAENVERSWALYVTSGSTYMTSQ